MVTNLMSLDQARLVNPVLTEVAQGYMKQDLIADILFPRVMSRARAGQIIQFGKESFKLYNTLRAPGEAIARINVGYAGIPFKLEQHALGVGVPIEHQEEAQEVLSLDLFDENLTAVTDAVRLGIENEAAVLATTAANYSASNKVTLSGTSQWSDSTNGISDPFKDIADAREQVRSLMGVRPNVAVIGPKVLVALQKHPKILDRLKYTSSQIPTMEDLARLFQLSRIVSGEAVTANDADVFSDVWGKFVVLAYSAIGSRSRKQPSYGYNYELKGSPVVTSPEFNRKTRTFEGEFIYEHGLQIVGKDAGFLITNAVA